jgi:hypothetical protein
MYTSTACKRCQDAMAWCGAHLHPLKICSACRCVLQHELCAVSQGLQGCLHIL